MAAKPAAAPATPLSAEQALYAANGRCQCAGQCGFTHAWTAEVSARPCGAPHACVIVRKLDYPSFWQLADTEGMRLAFPEHYNVATPILVELQRVTVPDGREGVTIAACQRCKLLIEEATGTGKKRRRRDG